MRYPSSRRSLENEHAERLARRRLGRARNGEQSGACGGSTPPPGAVLLS